MSKLFGKNPRLSDYESASDFISRVPRDEQAMLLYASLITEVLEAFTLIEKSHVGADGTDKQKSKRLSDAYNKLGSELSRQEEVIEALAKQHGVDTDDAKESGIGFTASLKKTVH